MVIAMETGHTNLQLRFCSPGETSADVFNRIVASKVHNL